MNLRWVLAALLLGELVWLYDTRVGLPDALGPVLTAWAQASPAQPTVVLVVLDTVRADHTAVCGYGRPTTPELVRLRDEEGAAVSCRMVSPGSWTMPSHASFFTGVAVPEHGVHFVLPTADDRTVFDGTGFYTRPLGPELPTLAEAFRARGYQTVSVSANPLIGPDTGLTRGFDHVVIENSPGWEVARRVRRLLRGTVDPARPLFLFVNLGDAHEPWEPVPSGLDWAPPRDGLGWGGPWSAWGLDELLPWLYPRTDDFERLVTRRMSPADKDAYIGHVTDVYDHGVLLADWAVARLLGDLRAHGWDAAGLRFVVTSDHGEHLGEHDLGDHGRFVHEPVVQVPLVVLDTHGAPDLPSPVSGVAVHSLVLDGVVPDPLPELATYAFADVIWGQVYGRGGHDAAAVYDPGTAKASWTDGQGSVGIDLGREPLLETPGPLPDHLRAPLEAAVDRMRGADRQGGGMTDDMAERLKEIGYVE